ncbi:MAG: glycolate oxidase subunit GlcF [Aestuariivirgaceae bacterium]|nr:glycolate oxidase subunit GlcF [Aestuariivirgaceae bacterium]
MKTNFTPAQLENPALQEADGILRACVHCGFCTATCPTYVLTGDERDSPRGRIYMIQEMLEKGGTPPPETVHHVDRCLSCLACMTTCPSGVHFAHLVDQARVHIETHHKRPLYDRLLRAMLANILARPERMRLALRLANFARPFAKWLGPQLQAMLTLAPAKLPAPQDFTGEHAATQKKMRVALLTGCAQSVLDPEINAATIRLLTRLGVEVVVPQGAGCCGSLAHHVGREDEAARLARANVKAWQDAKVDHVVINTSGCGTTVKDYAHAIGEMPLSVLDVSELLALLDLPALPPKSIKVAYHSACSLQHGQKLKTEPQALLTRAGFTLTPIAESHMCCGSAGTYNILQPEMALQLGTRKRANILRGRPDVIAAGNIGCLTQIALGLNVPVLHSIELLDWAYGGPKPSKIKGFGK